MMDTLAKGHRKPIAKKEGIDMLTYMHQQRRLPMIGMLTDGASEL